MFEETIMDWDSWAKVYQSIPTFTKLIESIWQKHGWAISSIENCQAGTNAVFKVGDKIIKIFAPIESTCDTQHDYDIEVEGILYAQNYVHTPELLAQGMIQDKYLFRYIVLKYIEGSPLSLKMFDYDRNAKLEIGKQLRRMTDAIGLPNVLKEINYLENAKQNTRWKSLPSSFQKERLEYLNQLELKSTIYVHGDLNGDNLIINSKQILYMIDFADALMAPIEYEWAVIICELFQFDRDYLKGYFGELSIDEYIRICIEGLLIHDFGANIIEDRISKLGEIKNINILKQKIREKLI